MQLLLRVLICSLTLQTILAFLVQPGTTGFEKIERSAAIKLPSTRFIKRQKTLCTCKELWKQMHGESHTPIQSLFPSTSRTQLMGLFGLGGLEIAVICVGVGVVLGPEKLASLIRATGETAGEFKNELSKVPDEFQKGYEEGQIEARSRAAKPTVPVDISKSSEDVESTK